MSIFDQLKNFSPEKIKELTQQAQQVQQIMNDMIEKKIAEEIQRRDLVSRKEVKKMISEK